MPGTSTNINQFQSHLQTHFDKMSSFPSTTCATEMML